MKTYAQTIEDIRKARDKYQTPQPASPTLGDAIPSTHPYVAWAKRVAYAAGIGAALAIGKAQAPTVYKDRTIIRTEYLTNTIEVCRYPGKALEDLGVKPTK